MRIPFLDFFILSIGKKCWAPLTFKHVEPFVNKEDHVLDIGAGGGWTAELLAKKKGVEVSLLDVEDFNRTPLPLILYDGLNIPLEDNSVDVSLLQFVLHHCADPLQVLKEAVRVTKKRIIIHEDTYSSSFGWVLTCANDFISNSPFFLADPLKMNMPYGYKKVSEWKQVFKELGLKVHFLKLHQHLLTKQVLFVLEKA